MSTKASFTSAACPINVGLTDAEQLHDETLTLVKNRADSLLDDALEIEQDLNKLAFPRLAFSFTFDGSGQLDQFTLPDRPEIDDSDLVFEKPDEPPVPSLTTITSLNPNTNFPSFSSSFLTSLINKITTMLTSAESLPSAWVEANWSAARDRLTRDENARKAQIEGEFARRGWSSATGVETARIDALRLEFIGQLSTLNRDIAIKVYEEALVSLRLAAQLGVEYLRAWVQAYGLYIDAASEQSQNEIRENQQLLQKLEAAIQIFDGNIRAEQGRVNVLLGKHGIDFQAYNSDINLRTAISQRDQAKFAQETERRRINADVKIQDNQSRIAARARDVQEASENLRARSDVIRQMGAALWQAVNVGTNVGISYGRSNTSSCSTSFSYSETAADA